MRILDRYIVREIFRHALLGLLVFTFVFFVPQLVRLMELAVRHTGNGEQVLQLFFSILPAVLTFTVPMAVLIGVLLGLGRMSADSEIIAMTALGIGRRRMLIPVAVLALTGALVTLAMTVWLGPRALRSFRAIEAQLISSQISFQVQPRVFDERFPRLVLYVNDVSASGTQWHGVFLAETGGESGSRLTLAENAIVIADPSQGKLELHMQSGSTHEFSREDADRYSVTDFGRSDWPIEFSALANNKPRALSVAERDTRDLIADRGPSWRESRVEFHRRLAFPAACFAFALVAVPLGSQPRRGGRAAGSIIAVILISLYYLLFVMGAGLAREGLVSPATGMWIANAALTCLALLLLPQLEQIRGGIGGPDWFVSIRKYLRLRRRRKAQARAARANNVRVMDNRAAGTSLPKGQVDAVPVQSSGSFPRLMDLYIVRRFLWYFLLLMAMFIFLFQAFTFFELLDDISKHRIPFLTVVNYFRYLTPFLVYQLAPLGALMAVLVTLGTMSKNNEIVAIKASGISLYRLAVPLFFGGLVLSGAMVFLDDVYLPYSNQRQDALRNQIKGRPPQTYGRPQRWIVGENSKIYNYDLFDPAQNLFGGLSVIELDPANFMVKRRIFATRAKWSETQRAWVLEAGWVRDFSEGAISRYEKFTITALPELTEPPTYFHREVRQAIQMSWRELRSYIEGLQRAGFDVAALKVQWHVKLAFPLIAPVSMLLAIPFAFLVGTRGALGGVSLGVGIGITYWVVSRLLEAMGNVGQMPPLLAGWSPDIIFFFFGMYFFFKMPT